MECSWGEGLRAWACVGQQPGHSCQLSEDLHGQHEASLLGVAMIKGDVNHKPGPRQWRILGDFLTTCRSGFSSPRSSHLPFWGPCQHKMPNYISCLGHLSFGPSGPGVDKFWDFVNAHFFFHRMKRKIQLHCFCGDRCNGPESLWICDWRSLEFPSWIQLGSWLVWFPPQAERKMPPLTFNYSQQTQKEKSLAWVLMELLELFFYSTV